MCSSIKDTDYLRFPALGGQAERRYAFGVGYRGVGAFLDDPWAGPPSGYTIDAGDEKMVEEFGGKGDLVRTSEQPGAALKQALDDDMCSIVNVSIDPHACDKPRQFAWLTN